MHCPSALRLQIRVLVRHAADRRPDVTDKQSVMPKAKMFVCGRPASGCHPLECLVLPQMALLEMMASSKSNARIAAEQCHFQPWPISSTLSTSMVGLS